MGTSMTDSAGPPGAAAPPGTAVAPPPRHRRWPIWTALATGSVLIAALITGTAFAARYQPAGPDGSPANLTGRLVTRQVNDSLTLTGQAYLPPQRPTTGAVYVNLTNNGPFPVTIESASLNPPFAQAPHDRQNQSLRDTGPATYQPAYGHQSWPGTRLAGLVLRPRQHITVRLPVTTAGCWLPDGYQYLSEFWVTTKFLLWTHQVPVTWTDPADSDEGAIVSHEPMPPSQGGICRR